MKYIKMLGLLAVAAAAFMAFAASASATSVTSSTGETPTIHATAGETTLHGAATVTCTESTVTGTVSAHGPGSTASGSISALTFGACTEDHVTVLTVPGNGANGTGTLEVHADPESPTGNGTLTSSGTRVTIQITGLVSCIFETQNTDIGTVTGGEHATLNINSANIPRIAGDSGIFCGGPGVWTGEYVVTHPTDLTIH